jgi:hypothetical protein
MKVGDLVRPRDGGYTEMRGLIMKVEPSIVEIFWFNPRHGNPRFGYSSPEGLEVA